MERIASATGVPCETSTSTWRSLDTISSGVCRFLRIVILRPALVSHTSGRTTSTGADQQRDHLEEWSGPEEVKQHLLADLEQKHRATREPYAMRVAELERQI